MDPEVGKRQEVRKRLVNPDQTEKKEIAQAKRDMLMARLKLLLYLSVFFGLIIYALVLGCNA